MKEKDLFLSYLEQEKNRCAEKEVCLVKEERKDEANLCKVEANIYEIFAVVYQTALQEAEKKQEICKAEELFLKKAKEIPENWKRSYETAKTHQDMKKILIEETKLAAAEKIMVEFERITAE